MIFVDPSIEMIPGSKSAPRLRELSGANAMISSMAMPPVNEAFVKKHIESGAILYRVVTTAELNEIKPEHLLVNLAKLIELGCATWQMVILYDSSHTLPDYDKVVARIDSWVEHGGTAMSTMGHALGHYLITREKRFLENKGKPTIIYPAFKPRNDLIVRKDWTVTLASFPLLGDAGAQAVRKIINEQQLGDDLLMALVFLTDENAMKTSNGQWHEVRKRAREWLGLPDGFNLGIEFNNITVTEIKD